VVIALPAAISSDTDLTITWSLEEGVETRASLTGPADYLNALDWQTGGSWQVGKLEKGKYILMVEARNAVGIASTTQDFTVSRQNMPPETHMEYLPQGSKTTSVKLSWVVDSGAATIDHFDLQWREANGEWIDWAEPLERNARTVNFWAAPDQLYEFRIRAVDKDGMEEASPLSRKPPPSFCRIARMTRSRGRARSIVQVSSSALTCMGSSRIPQPSMPSVDTSTRRRVIRTQSGKTPTILTRNLRRSFCSTLRWIASSPVSSDRIKDDYQKIL